MHLHRNTSNIKALSTIISKYPRNLQNDMSCNRTFLVCQVCGTFKENCNILFKQPKFAKLPDPEIDDIVLNMTYF